MKRGISGGERKRVCVAIELLLHPNVLMLDEPTSGYILICFLICSIPNLFNRLDSSSSLSLCKTLKDLAASGACTVITTIHQPQTKIFELFDDLIILNKGHVLYRGPRSEVLQFYEEAGLPCPPLTNPADHLLDVVTFVAGCDRKKMEENDHRLRLLLKKREAKLSGKQKHSKGGYSAVDEEEEQLSEDDPDINKQTEEAVREWVPDPSPRTPWLKQFSVLARRSLKENLRNRTAIIAQVIQNIIMAILIGTVFLHIGHGQSSTTRRQPVLFFCVINQVCHFFFAAVVSPLFIV